MRKYVLVALLPLMFASVWWVAEFGIHGREDVGWYLALLFFSLPVWVFWAGMVFAHWHAFGRTHSKEVEEKSESR